MHDAIIHLILILSGALLALLSVVLGAYIMFRGKSKTGESFTGSAQKGEVFTIPDANDLADFPSEEPNEAEKHITKKTSQFVQDLKGLTGDK